MNPTQRLLVALISALVALLPFGVVIWLTSGTGAPMSAPWASLVLVAPLMVATILGLGRCAGLGLCFLIFWAITYTLVARYAKANALEVRG